MYNKNYNLLHYVFNKFYVFSFSPPATDVFTSVPFDSEILCLLVL
jgi:hypothetical protein